MEAYIISAWISLLVRWWHVFSGILWIGQTYLFNRLERNLKKSTDSPDHVIGGVWMVHGGGYFFLEKQSFPVTTPETLLWFKWASLSTWVSGLVLLLFTYYHGGALVEIGGESEQNYTLAVVVGLAVIFSAWFAYDYLLRSKFGKNEFVFGTLAYFLVLMVAYLLPFFLSKRASYVHVGSMLGTIMAANVWLRILPAMRKIIELRSKGETVSQELLSMGPQRSKHNSFIVAPLILIMISNHYPVISYGGEHPVIVLGVWLILGWSFAKIMKG